LWWKALKTKEWSIVREEKAKSAKRKKRTGRTIVVSKKEKKDNWKDYSREYNNFKNPIYGSDTILQKAKQSEY